MAYETIALARADGVATLTLNRPDAYNALNLALGRDLFQAVLEVDDDASVRAVVITGAGKAFSGGGDLNLLDRMVGDLELRDFVMAEGVEIVRAMMSVRVPIVAAVNGPAVGLGCSLAAMSDLVVAEEQAYFADPHVALGLVAADGGAITWPLLMSLLRAKEFILLGDRVPAAEALQLGLANRVVPTGQALTVAVELAERLAALPPQAVAETKAVMNGALLKAVGSVLDESIAAETKSFDEPAFQANLARMLKK